MISTSTAARRFAYPLILAAAMGSAALGAGSIASAHPSLAVPRGFKSYSNTKAGYTINYPASWKPVADNSTDLFVGAPDRHAFLTATASPIDPHVTSAQIQAQQKKVLIANHLVAGTSSFNVKVINGVRFQLGEGITKQGSSLVDTLILDTVRHGTLYDIDAGLVLKAHSTQSEKDLLVKSLNSITVR